MAWFCFPGDGFSTNGKVAVRSGLMVAVYTIHSAWWHDSGTVVLIIAVIGSQARKSIPSLKTMNGMAAMSAHSIVSQDVMFANASLKTIDGCSLSFLYRITPMIWKSYVWYGINFHCCFAMSSRASIRKPPTPVLAALNQICASLFAHDAVCERYMTEFLSYLSLMADVKVDRSLREGGKKESGTDMLVT